VYSVPVQQGHHALHGHACFQPWTVERADATSCRIAVELDGGWPFGGRAVQEFRVLDDGIVMRMEVHAGDAAFPAGCGWHPWFRRDVRPGHDARLLVDAERWYETGDMIPTGWLMPALDDYDLRTFPELGERRLDTCYRDVRGPLRIAWGDVELTMERSANLAHVVVYTPAEAVCLEPQTCAIDAFNLHEQGIAGAGMAVVAPGQPLVATTTWRWRVVAGQNS
jgi:galactose mutarotase-like enzyme